jgi:elongation factor Ts
VAEITAGLVKELRDKSGAGMMDCKKALTATGGDQEKALDELRKQGLASAQKKSLRATKDGAVDSYIHAGGKIGVLVEVGVETDFVARSEPFREFTHDLAMQVAADEPEKKTHKPTARKPAKTEKTDKQAAPGKSAAEGTGKAAAKDGSEA